MQASCGEHFSSKHSPEPQAAAGLAAQSCKSIAPITKNYWAAAGLLQPLAACVPAGSVSQTDHKAAAGMLKSLALRALLALSGHLRLCWLFGFAVGPCCRRMLAAAGTAWEGCLQAEQELHALGPPAWSNPAP